jgi:peptidoglycan hydrolase-like protein with peptidoglycan-binding domain
MRQQYWILLALVVGVAAWGCGNRKTVSPGEKDTPYAFTAATERADEMGDAAMDLFPEEPVVAGGRARAIPPTSGTMADPMAIQQALANAGFYAGRVDGKIGPRTRQSIMDFQAAHHLTSDGIVGPNTWSVLQEFLADE